MKFTLTDINKCLLITGFIIANSLWFKTLYDIYAFQFIRPSFSFPKFFVVIFVIGAITTLLLTFLCLKGIFKTNNIVESKKIDLKTLLIWLAIPISVICTSFICYRKTIFCTPYIISTIIRIGLLITPLLALILYYKISNKIGVFVLLSLSILLLLPNDKCYNPFNYWWIEKFGASPLTYLPTMFVILFSVTGFYGKNKNLIITIIYGMSAAALFVSIGHRIRLLW